jgi:hypothetical protein
MRRLLFLALISFSLHTFSEDDFFLPVQTQPESDDIEGPLRLFDTLHSSSPSGISDSFSSWLPDMGATVTQQIKRGLDEDCVDERLFVHLLLNAPDDILILIETLSNEQLCDDWPHALLLEGRPGVGKSTYARVIAQALKRRFVFIKTPSLANEYQHSGSQNIERLFLQLFEMAESEPIVIIFDEINAITDYEKQKRVVDKGTSETLWMWLDKCAANKNILIIGTTNDATQMREQLISRFDADIITIDVPDEPLIRKSILEFHLSSRSNSCCTDFIEQFAGQTKGLSPRALEKLIIKARQYAALRDAQNPVIGADDLEVAFMCYQQGREKVTKPFYKRWSKPFLKYGVPIITCLASLSTVAAFMVSLYRPRTGYLR